MPLPDELEIYFWPYPSKKQVVIKNIAKKSIYRKDTFFGHVIKFLPLGFWLVWNKPASVSINERKLVPNKAMGIDDEQQVTLDLYNIPALDFPERPEDHEVIALNNNYAVTATPKEHKQ